MTNLVASSMTDGILVGIASHRQIGCYFCLPNGVRIFYRPRTNEHNYVTPISATCYKEVGRG